MKYILVIDDEEILVKTFTRLLKMQGYHPVVASGSDEALAKVRENDFNLILSDIRMPGRDGVETMQEIYAYYTKQSKPNPPVIFLTGFADKALEDRAQELKPVAYFHKPFDVPELLKTIKKALSKS